MPTAEPLTPNPALIAACGLYCGACGRYLKGGCPGCAENQKASWCKIRSCNLEHHYKSCAECTELTDPNDCKKFNNLMSKFFAVVFNSNRRACILKVRELGPDSYAAFMAEARRQSLPRRG
jgi:hypothetical protein